MTYQDAVNYLFNAAPLFQNVGAGAYKEGLANTLALDAHFGHPHTAYRTIHVAGTNGKGSVCHTLAAILQAAGLKVGLYTSPHLVDFRERIRINGQMIPEGRVVRFVEQERDFFEPLHPSFFELATALAFTYFKEEAIDVAVVEVGLGGRLDCTNIIRPMLSVITNISFDHTQFLGHTLPEIAREKAGIIKQHVPVVVGETNGHTDVREVFETAARNCDATLCFADEMGEVEQTEPDGQGGVRYQTRHHGQILGTLGGECQKANTATILAAVDALNMAGLSLTDEQVRQGFLHVAGTGLMGRWQILAREPLTICDTGHNVAGLQYTSHQLENFARPLHIIIGMVSDKDIRTSLRLMPKHATYYFTQASVQRALPAEDFARIAREEGLQGQTYPDVPSAFRAATQQAKKDDIVFVGGSTFIVADLLKNFFA